MLHVAAIGHRFTSTCSIIAPISSMTLIPFVASLKIHSKRHITMVGIDVISKYLSLQCPFPYQSSRLLYHIYPISQVASKSSNDVESNRESNKVPIYCFILVGYFD